MLLILNYLDVLPCKIGLSKFCDFAILGTIFLFNSEHTSREAIKIGLIFSAIGIGTGIGGGITVIQVLYLKPINLKLIRKL